MLKSLCWEHLPVLEGHVGDFHFDLFLEPLLSGQLEEPLGHLLVNLGVPLAQFQIVVVFLPNIHEGFHFGVGPVWGPSVFLTVAWYQVAETIICCHVFRALARAVCAGSLEVALKAFLPR